jgi:hypothetical protein
MDKSPLFYTDEHRQIESRIIEVLNSEPGFLSARSLGSPRAVGDAVQEVIGDRFEAILGDRCRTYSHTFARRAMADVAFYDTADFYHVVDVKTHNLGTRFNMPNLTSVERLARFYEDDKNCFTLLIVKYESSGGAILFRQAHFVPIEFLSWDCLAIGALGWGQIQISNANVIEIRQGYSRRTWMLELCDAMAEFYPHEVEKIGRRSLYFERVRADWEARPDDDGGWREETVRA